MSGGVGWGGMVCPVVLCCDVLCYGVLWYTVVCCVVACSVVLCYVVLNLLHTCFLGILTFLPISGSCVFPQAFQYWIWRKLTSDADDNRWVPLPLLLLVVGVTRLPTSCQPCTSTRY